MLHAVGVDIIELLIVKSNQVKLCSSLYRLWLASARFNPNNLSWKCSGINGMKENYDKYDIWVAFHNSGIMQRSPHFCGLTWP
jgi:hypothetical protein